MENPLKKLFSHFKLKTDDGKGPTKMGYILLIALTGILILIVSSMIKDQTANSDELSLINETEISSEDIETSASNKGGNRTSEVKDLEKEYEESLTMLLEEITGVSQVEIMVNLDSTNKKVYEKNLIIGTQTTEETDQNGGERQVKDSTQEEEVVIVRQGDKEVPLIIQTRKPEVRGVLVVAKGVDHIELKKWVVEAVSRVLDVPSHRISVMPKK
ncbi:stage III sporulation protein AG [Aquibacillus albus]|uniref:Stage III sporulation protein AG n=1 Tax=Aquibacillus albus TaxID=1168171 RepID=A0ABS2MV30_9BACI|nr:stage III sporulation protein AG [Aquibacillus albus]